jgi:hypothetical protein
MEKRQKTLTRKGFSRLPNAYRARNSGGKLSLPFSKRRVFLMPGPAGKLA